MQGMLWWNTGMFHNSNLSWRCFKASTVCTVTVSENHLSMSTCLQWRADSAAGCATLLLLLTMRRPVWGLEMSKEMGWADLMFRDMAGRKMEIFWRKVANMICRLLGGHGTGSSSSCCCLKMWWWCPLWHVVYPNFCRGWMCFCWLKPRSCSSDQSFPSCFRN